jgi:uncharacterized glyoxalase superfamily protein PhnB
MELSFGGCCEEALESYRKALGARVEMLMLHKDRADVMTLVPPTWEKEMIPFVGAGQRRNHSFRRL